MRKRFGIASLVLLLAAAVGYAWIVRPKAAVAATEVPRAQVVRDTLFQAVACTGRVLSNLDVDIKAKASGQVVTLPFDISQAVHKGDLLAELDPINQQRLVKQAEVSQQQSRAKLVQSEKNLLIAEQNLATNRSRVEAAVRSAEVRGRDTQTKA